MVEQTIPEKRYKPCGSDSCCYTNDREYVEKLERELAWFRKKYPHSYAHELGK